MAIGCASVLCRRTSCGATSCKLQTLLQVTKLAPIRWVQLDSLPSHVLQQSKLLHVNHLAHAMGYCFICTGTSCFTDTLQLPCSHPAAALLQLPCSQLIATLQPPYSYAAATSQLLFSAAATLPRTQLLSLTMPQKLTFTFHEDTARLAAHHAGALLEQTSGWRMAAFMATVV